MTDEPIVLHINTNNDFCDLEYRQQSPNESSAKSSKIVCVLCYKHLRNQADYTAHMNTFHHLDQTPVVINSKPFPCSDCKETFKTLPQLDAHNQQFHAQVWLLQCTLCGNYSNSPLDTGSFLCSQCNQESIPLMNPKLAVSHLWTEPSVVSTNFSCSRCHQCFNTQIELRDHRISEHPQHYRAYLCRHNRCNQKFLKYEQYIRHLDLDHKLKHTCELCEKSFTAPQTLRQHMRTHTGEKPFRCTECGRSFAVKDYLNKHIRVHTGEKPYECRLCNARFTQQTAMTIHMRNSCPVKNENAVQDGDGERQLQPSTARRRRKLPTPIQLLDPLELFKTTKMSGKRRK